MPRASVSRTPNSLVIVAAPNRGAIWSAQFVIVEFNSIYFKI